jgi:hypothetical protein
MLQPLPPLDAALVARGGEPNLVGDELIWAIEQRIAAHPRSLQRTIGPSEIGTPCLRKLGLKLSGAPTRERAAWRPTVGTAVHTWLADTFMRANEALGHSRYLIETTVEVGEVDGVTVRGSADLYDRATATVVDWKIVGPTTLKKVKASGVSDVYRTQVQLYGNGFVRRGAPVDTVAVMFLPVSGDLRDALYRPMPYDPNIASMALTRADAIAYAIRLAGPERMIPELERVTDYCASCDYFTPGTNDLGRQCPGSPETLAAQANSAARQLSGLVIA